MVRYLTLEHHCDPLRSCSEARTSFHCAAFSGHNIDVVRFFVEELKCDPNTKSISGFPVFHCAVASGDIETVKILVNELGFDPLIKDSEQKTAVHVAAICGNLPVLRYLIEDEECDPNITDIAGLTPLLLSAGHGQLHILQYLINELEIDKNSYNPESLETPLCAAAICGHLPVLTYLLEIGSDHFDRRCVTPLHHAANNGKMEIVKYLMTKHPNMYSFHPVITPLGMATLNGDLIMVKYFLEEAHCSNQPDPYGSTLVHIAAAHGHLDIVDYLVCDMNCDPLMETKKHITPLLLACHGGHLEVLKFYFEKLNVGPKVSLTIITGDKPIHIATLMGHLNVVKYLVEELKCDVNSVNTKFNSLTPMHYAAQKGHLDIVQYLIEKKANIVCCNLQGDTPIHAAAIGDQLQVVKFLTSKIKSKSVDFKMKRTPLQAALQSSKDTLSLTALYLIVTEFNSLQ